MDKQSMRVRRKTRRVPSGRRPRTNRKKVPVRKSRRIPDNEAPRMYQGVPVVKGLIYYCVPATIALVTDHNVHFIERELRSKGFKREHGGTDTSWLTVTNNRHWGHAFFEHSAHHGKTLNQFLETIRYYTGSYVIELNHHWLCVINGVLIDSGNVGWKKKIRRLWKVTQIS